MKPIWLIPTVLLSLSAGIALRTETGTTFNCPPARRGRGWQPSITMGNPLAVSTTTEGGDSPPRGALRLHMKSGAKVDIHPGSATESHEDGAYLVGAAVSGSRVVIPLNNIDFYEYSGDQE